MDPVHSFFNITDEHWHVQFDSASQPRFAQNITNTVEPYHPATVIENYGQENREEQWGTGGWSVPLSGTAPNHFGVLMSNNGLVAGPGPAGQQGYEHVGSGNNTLHPTLIAGPPALAPVHMRHPPPAGSSTHRLVPKTTTYLENHDHYYPPATTTGYLAPTPLHVQAATHYAQQTMPTKTALGKRRARPVETEPVQFPNSIEPVIPTSNYTAFYSGYGLTGINQREWDQEGDFRDFKKPRQAYLPAAGPSSASSSEPDTGEAGMHDTDEEASLDDPRSTAGGVADPQIKKRTRTGGHCPFCGVFMTRKYGLRKHFGKGKICQDLYLSGQGIVKYSLDDLTQDQIAIARAAGRVAYDPGMQPALVGPGEIARRGRPEKQSLRGPRQPSGRKHQFTAPSLPSTGLAAPNPDPLSTLGNYVENPDVLTINWDGLPNPHSHIAEPQVVINGYSYQVEDNPVTQWATPNADASDVLRRSQQHISDAHHQSMVAALPFQRPNRASCTPGGWVVEDARWLPVSYPQKPSMNDTLIQGYPPCQVSNTPLTAYPHTRIPPSPQEFGSEDMLNVPFDFRFPFDLPAASPSSAESASGEEVNPIEDVATAFDDPDAPQDQLSVEQEDGGSPEEAWLTDGDVDHAEATPPYTLPTSPATDDSPNHGVVVEAFTDLILDPDFLLPPSGSVPCSPI